MGGGSAQKQDDEHNEEDEREAAAAVVAETRAHAVAAKAEDEDQDDEKNKHGRLRSARRFVQRPVQGPEELDADCAGRKRQRQKQMRGFFPFTAFRVRMTNKYRQRQKQIPSLRCGMTNK